MAVKFPDIIKHENENYAILDINDIRGIYAIDSFDTENILAIPADKRRRAGILSVVGGKLYVYKSVSLADQDWSTPGNWREMGEGGGQQSGDYIEIYSSTEDVQSLKYGDCDCVYCSSTNQIYKYVENGDGVYDTLNDPYVIKTGDQSSTEYSGPRFVSLFYLNGITLTAGKGIEIDYSENTISVEVDKPKNTSMSISPQWTTSTGETSTSANYSVEYGKTVDLSATYKWTHNNDKKDPSSASGDLGSELPESGVDSQVFEITGISDTRTFTETLTFDKKGLVVNSERQVVYAEGTDSYSKSVSVTFKDRRYYGESTSESLDSAGITALSEQDLKSEYSSETITATNDNSNYFYYSYPQSFGEITSVIQNGSLPVIDAFLPPYSVNVTNSYGSEKAYYVYRSRNKGSFANASLEITIEKNSI